MVDLADSDASAITRAGALLDMAGRGGLGDASLAATYSLQAADLLASVVQLPDPVAVPMQSSDAAVAIGEALRLLATLSETTFGLPPVVAAVDAAQQAHRAASA